VTSRVRGGLWPSRRRAAKLPGWLKGMGLAGWVRQGGLMHHSDRGVQYVSHPPWYLASASQRDKPLGVFAIANWTGRRIQQC
jgi:hypothetical protein